MESKGFEAYCRSALAHCDAHRKPSLEIAGSDYAAAFFEYKYRRRAVDRLLRVPDALYKIILLGDERRCELCLVYPSACHGLEMSVRSLEHDIRDLVDVIDDAHGADRIYACRAAEEQRLGIHVAYAADRRITFHLADNAFEFCPERRVLYIMDLALESPLYIV